MKHSHKKDNKQNKAFTKEVKELVIRYDGIVIRRIRKFSASTGRVYLAMKKIGKNNPK